MTNNMFRREWNNRGKMWRPQLTGAQVLEKRWKCEHGRRGKGRYVRMSQPPPPSPILGRSTDGHLTQWGGGGEVMGGIYCIIWLLPTISRSTTSQRFLSILARWSSWPGECHLVIFLSPGVIHLVQGGPPLRPAQQHLHLGNNRSSSPHCSWWIIIWWQQPRTLSPGAIHRQRWCPDWLCVPYTRAGSLNESESELPVREFSF
jgi:hypothetical protein